MSFKLYKIILFAFGCILICISNVDAQDSYDKKHIEVSLRMIGHQVLLNSGDSTSRVLPIIKSKDRYEIQFDTEFEFIPEEMVMTVDRVMKETEIGRNYILEVEECGSEKIVYSYERDIAKKSGILQCSARFQPSCCYNILLTLMEPSEEIAALNESVIDPFIDTPPTIPHRNTTPEKSQISYIPIYLLTFMLGGTFFFFWNRKKQSENKIDPNIIPLGEYRFDKRNTELLIDDQKIELTSKEADLLMLLYDTVNTTVKREVLLKMVWGDNGDYVGRTLDVFISKLRKKLDADSSVKIVNIRGVGYKLVMNG